MGPFDFLEMATSFRVVRNALLVAVVVLYVFDRADLLAVWHWILDIEVAQATDAFKTAILDRLASG